MKPSPFFTLTNSRWKKMNNQIETIGLIVVLLTNFIQLVQQYKMMVMVDAEKRDFMSKIRQVIDILSTMTKE